MSESLCARASVSEKSSNSAEDTHERKPYALDISMGKNEPKYNVHAYATKVPPGAITPLIEHYCEQGDVILDPFSGTGMTGVALEDSGLEGIAILQDLSPGATHIAWALQQRIDAGEFRQAASAILRDVTKECGWMYATKLGAKEKPSDILCGRMCTFVTPVVQKSRSGI